MIQSEPAAVRQAPASITAANSRMLRRLILSCAAGMALSIFVVLCGPFHWGSTSDGRNDFRAFYAGGRLAGTRGLYDPETVYRVEDATTTPWGPADPGARRALIFIRLPWFALLLHPLTMLPYLAAYYLWVGIMLAALALFAVMWPGEWRIKGPAVCCCLPAFRGIFSGQDVTLVLLWFGVSLYLWRRRRPFAAGLAMAVCGAKFHLLCLLPLAVVAQRRWRFGAGLASGAAGLLAVSFAAGGGSDWPRRYLKVIADPRINAAVAHMPTLHVLAHGRLWAETGMAFLMTVAVWHAARRAGSFEWAAALSVGGGMLVAIHGDMQDCCLLLPAILLLLEADCGRWVRLPAIALASPVPWFWLKMPPPFPDVTRLLLMVFVLATAVHLSRSRSMAVRMAPTEGPPCPSLPSWCPPSTSETISRP